MMGFVKSFYKSIFVEMSWFVVMFVYLCSFYDYRIWCVYYFGRLCVNYIVDIEFRVD